MNWHYIKWHFDLSYTGFLRWKIRRIKKYIKCFFTGGHKFSENEWGYCFACGKGMVQYVCSKCYTPIAEVPLEDFKKKDLIFNIKK